MARFAKGNRGAFLDAIAYSEGTAGVGDDGYNVLCGSLPGNPKLFTSYDDHPRILVDLGHGLKSTAAGKFQILERYYDAYADLLGLEDFSPENQERIALQQIGERHALLPIDQGHFAAAIALCCNLWASLPGAGYSQRENTIESLTQAYLAADGTISGE